VALARLEVDALGQLVLTHERGNERVVEERHEAARGTGPVIGRCVHAIVHHVILSVSLFDTVQIHVPAGISHKHNRLGERVGPTVTPGGNNILVGYSQRELAAWSGHPDLAATSCSGIWALQIILGRLVDPVPAVADAIVVQTDLTASSVADGRQRQ
jgi:hypothetical protein